NDLYHADLFGQGFASTWGCGVLVDLAGNDVYDAGGVHSDAPLHRDRTQSLSQGFAIGMRPDASGGVGVLVDVAGNDRYLADIYGQGASYWFSLGLLIADHGSAAPARDTGGIGLLLDAGGADVYSEPLRDGKVWTDGLVGAGIDDPTPPDAAPASDPMGAAISKEAAAAAVDKDGRVAGPDG